MRIDHLTLQALHQRAHRERAEAVYRLIVAPVIRFFARPATAGRAPLRSRLA
jgi:hypothetical protein